MAEKTLFARSALGTCSGSEDVDANGMSHGDPANSVQLLKADSFEYTRYQETIGLVTLAEASLPRWYQSPFRSRKLPR